MQVNFTAEGFGSADRIKRSRCMGAVGLIATAVGVILTAVSYIESNYGVGWFICDNEDLEARKAILLDYKLLEANSDKHDKNHKD